MVQVLLMLDGISPGIKSRQRYSEVFAEEQQAEFVSIFES